MATVQREPPCCSCLRVVKKALDWKRRGETCACWRPASANDRWCPGYGRQVSSPTFLGSLRSSASPANPIKVSRASLLPSSLPLLLPCTPPCHAMPVFSEGLRSARYWCSWDMHLLRVAMMISRAYLCAYSSRAAQI